MEVAFNILNKKSQEYITHSEVSFYINDEAHGPIAFTNLTQGGVYYPAVSLNKNVQLTLVSGLNPPTQANHEL